MAPAQDELERLLEIEVGVGKIPLKAALAGLCVAAFLARLWGIAYGLPDLFHIDEPEVIKMSLAYGAKGSLEPIGYTWGTLFSYLLFFEFSVYFLWGRLWGWFPTVEDFAFHTLTEPTALYLIGRLTCAVAGALVVWPVFFLGRRMGGERVGFTAACLAAFSPLSVALSRVTGMDVPVALWAALFWALWFRMVREGNSRDGWKAAALVGAAAATKYNGGLLIVPLLLGGVVSVSGWKRLLPGYLAVAALVFFIGCPYALLRFSDFWTYGVLHQAAYASYGNLGKMGEWPWLWMLSQGFGREPVLCALGGAGLVWGLWRGDRPVRLLCVSILLWLGLTGATLNQDLRYHLPLLPAFAVLAAHLLGKGGRRGLLLSCLAVCLAGGQVALEAYPLTLSDTRTRAREWIEQEIPAGARIAMDWHGPTLLNEEAFTSGHTRQAVLTASLRERLRRHLEGRSSYRVVPLRRLSGKPDLEPLTPDKAQELRRAWLALGYVFPRHEDLAREGIRYVVTSRRSWGRYFDPSQEPEEGNVMRRFYLRDRAFYEVLLSDPGRFRKIREFVPRGREPGPELSVYEVVAPGGKEGA
jgi:hypothetical protein